MYVRNLMRLIRLRLVRTLGSSLCRAIRLACRLFTKKPNVHAINMINLAGGGPKPLG